MQFLNPHGIRFKIVVYTLLCLSLIGVCSNLFLYSYMNSIITEKASAIDSMYLETIRVQLDAKLSEVNDLAVLCASEPELARVMQHAALALPSEKRQALRVQEQLNAYLHSCAQSDYINKLKERGHLADDQEPVQSAEKFGQGHAGPHHAARGARPARRLCGHPDDPLHRGV